MNLPNIDFSELSFDELHNLAVLTEEAANSPHLKSAPDALSDWFMDLHTEVDSAFLACSPSTPAQALIQIMRLAADAIGSEYAQGPAVLANARSALEVASQ